jgi:hypothetical protein
MLGVPGPLNPSLSPPLVFPTHLHPAPAYAGPALPDCTWGVPVRAPSGSHWHTRSQQLQQVTTPTSRRGIGGGGCPAGAERRRHRGEGEAAKKRGQRCYTRSTFETSGCNICNIRMKADETHETSI